MNLEELQQAITILYNPQANNQALIQQAQAYCQAFIRDNATQLPEFFKLYLTATNDMVRYWLLQAIAEIVDSYYAQVMQSEADRRAIHQLYIQILRENPNLIFAQKYSINRYALIFVHLLKHDYPFLWQNAFQDVFGLVNQTQDLNLQKNYMCFAVNCILIFEEELVERTEQTTAKSLEISNRVKQGIRDFAIQDVLFLLFQALANYQLFPRETINDILAVIAKLIDWNTLDFFAQGIDLFKGFLTQKKYRANAMKCLHAIVHKGMDYPLKIELIANLGYLEILESLQMKNTERTEEISDTDETLEEDQFFITVAESVDKLGQWCLELFQNHEKLLPGLPDHQRQYEIILRRVLEITLRLLDTDRPKIGRPCLEFLSFWLQAIKKMPDIGEYQLMIVQNLLQVVIKRVKYPNWCTYEEGSVLSEHEEEYIVYREELANVFINIAMIKQFQPTLLQILAQLFQSIVPGKTLFNQAEAPLYLCFHLYQAIPTELREQTVNNPYCELLQFMLSIDFFSYDHKIVSIMFLENIVKYSAYFFANPQFIGQISQIFFSNRAIYSMEPHLASRSVYLLLRLCEKYQDKMFSQVQIIINSCLDVIGKVESGLSSQEHTLTYDDLQYLYNVIGLFAANRNIDSEYRKQVVAQVMESLYGRLGQCQPIEKDKITWMLKFINVFIKGFHSEISIFMKESFAKVLQQLLSILQDNYKNQHIVDQIIQYVQKNIVLLGPDFVPFLQQMAIPYLKNIEFERLDSFLTMITHASINLRGNLVEFLDQIFSELLSKVSQNRIPSSDTSDIDKISIKIFQQYLKFVQNALETDSQILFSIRNQQNFVPFINYLITHFEQNCDKTVKRIITLILRELFIDFSGISSKQVFTKRTGANLGSPTSPTDQQTLTNNGQFDKSIVNKYPEFYQFFVETALSLVTRYLLVFNPIQLEDNQVLKNMVEIHALYYMSGFAEQLRNFLAANAGLGQEAILFISQECERVIGKQTTLKQFQDNYIKMLIQIKQQSGR